MSRFRDMAVANMETARKTQYREESRILTAQAQVYALLDLADTIRTQQEKA